MRTAVDLTVTGRVQGVSFRMYAEQEAARLGVAGWVRNDPDGSVAAHAEGTPDAVEAFVAWCREGSPFARVVAVESVPAADTGATTFEVRS